MIFGYYFLYPATLLNLFNSSKSFLVEYLGYSIYSIMSSANNDYFTFSFPIWMPFISSSCLNAVNSTFSTTLKRVVESDTHVLFQTLREALVVFAH